MATATVSAVWMSTDGLTVWGAAWVEEGPPAGRVEYIGNTPYLGPDGNPKSGQQIQADLLAELAAIRARQAGPPAALPGYAGQTYQV